jgi:hypothetical protein
MSGTSKKPSFGDVVSAASLGLGLITGLVYLAGWTYAYYFFDRFRIPLTMIDLPLEHYIVYGVLVFYKYLWGVLLVGVLLVAALWCVSAWSHMLGRFGIATSVAVLALVAFLLARQAGVEAAEADFLQQRNSDYAAYPRIRFGEGVISSKGPNVLGDLTENDCGRLLASSRDLLFVIRPVQKVPGLELDTLVISLAKAETFRIEANYTSCK